MAVWLVPLWPDSHADFKKRIVLPQRQQAGNTEFPSEGAGLTVHPGPVPSWPSRQTRLSPLPGPSGMQPGAAHRWLPTWTEGQTKLAVTFRRPQLSRPPCPPAATGSLSERLGKKTSLPPTASPEGLGPTRPVQSVRNRVPCGLGSGPRRSACVSLERGRFVSQGGRPAPAPRRWAPGRWPLGDGGVAVPASAPRPPRLEPPPLRSGPAGPAPPALPLRPRWLLSSQRRAQGPAPPTARAHWPSR